MDQYVELKEKIQLFIEEALPISEKTAYKDNYAIPQYHIETKGTNNLISCHYSDILWNDEKLMGDITVLSGLKTYKDALDLCKKTKGSEILNNKMISGLGLGRGMSYIYMPYQFLMSMLFNERSYNFRQEIFDRIFSDFMTIVSEDHFSNARIIVPLIGFNMAEEVIELEKGKRIRKVNLDEVVNLLNRFTNLNCYYTTYPPEQFTYVLEIDFKINWRIEDFGVSTSLKDAQKDSAAIFIMRMKINEELMILRALTKSCVSVKNFCTYYQGWLSNNYQGGFANGYHCFPWSLPKFSSPSTSSMQYIEYRKKYLNLPENASKHKIFFAMRKLAFGLEKLYGCDEIFDTISGLEGLLVPPITNGKPTPQKPMKCINAVSSILTGKIQDIAALRKDLEKAYDFRNDVAHGDFTLDDPDLDFTYDKEISKTICRIRKYRQITRNSLHEAIKSCIDNPSLIP